MDSKPTIDADKIPYKWAEAWSGKDAEPWVALYSPTAKYTDHAFQIIRQGHPALRSHWTLWLTSHPDFTMDIESLWPSEDLSGGRRKYSLRTNNNGTFIKDLLRKKASGKTFWFRGVVDLTINLADGLIEEVEEWYCPNFEQTTSLENYNFNYKGIEEVKI